MAKNSKTAADKNGKTKSRPNGGDKPQPAGRSSRLSRFPVAGQIGFLASMGVVGLIGVGIYVFFSIQNLLHYAHVEQEKAHELVLMKNFDRNFLEARSEGKDYFITSLPAHLDKRAKAMDEARGDLDRLAKLPLTAEEKANLATIRELMEQFDKQFAVVLSHIQETGLNEQTRHEIESLNGIYLKADPFIEKTADLLQKETDAAVAEAEHAGMQAEIITGIVALGVTLLVLMVSFFVGRGIAKPLSELSEVIAKLAKGDVDVVVTGTDRADEIGMIARASEEMRIAMIDNVRLNQMVDGMPINVMTIDPEDLTINYINKTSLATLAPWEKSLACPLNEIRGGDINVFLGEHAPEQRKIIAEKSNLPHRAKIRFGEEMLDLNASAVEGRNGEHLATMLAWTVVTQNLKLADDFEANVKGVVDTVSASSTEMQATAQAMSATAEETNRQSTAVAAASEQATNNVQTVASAAEELSASVSEISNQVANSTKIAKSAVDKATGTNAQIQELASAAQKIDEVVKLISDIAEQTNLLALNATIEAARAGDAGKGFAVVASEVKSLANQTAQATDEIAAQIAAVQSATTNAVTAIEEITKVIGEINEISTAVASAVEEQGAATQEIARNVQEAAAGTQEVSSNIGGVTQAAAETGTSAQRVLDAAGQLTLRSEELSNEVDRFLSKVRSG